MSRNDYPTHKDLAGPGVWDEPAPIQKKRNTAAPQEPKSKREKKTK